jgi:beta-glucanase (GH16 family)
MTETINCFNREWLTRMRWGSIHDKPGPRANCWYDPTAITVYETGRVDLNIHHNPKTFIIDQEGQAPLNLHADYGVGLLCSVENFLYGTFILEAKLPKGNYLWPAFWLYTATEHRAEEIDIMEGYSRDTGYRAMGGMCGKTFRGWNIQSCMHVNYDAKSKGLPAKYPDCEDFDTDPASEYVRYGLLWKPDEIAFFINEDCIRLVLDKKLLQYFQSPMMVIINNHIDGRYYKQFSLNGVTPFEIRKFEYVA